MMQLSVSLARNLQIYMLALAIASSASAMSAQTVQTDP